MSARPESGGNLSKITDISLTRASLLVASPTGTADPSAGDVSMVAEERLSCQTHEVKWSLAAGGTQVRGERRARAPRRLSRRVGARLGTKASGCGDDASRSGDFGGLHPSSGSGHGLPGDEARAPDDSCIFVCSEPVQYVVEASSACWQVTENGCICIGWPDARWRGRHRSFVARVAEIAGRSSAARPSRARPKGGPLATQKALQHRDRHARRNRNASL